MPAAPHAAVVIPCFQEAAHIGAVVTAARQHLSHVIVVDDGSTDDTAARAAAAGAEVIRHPANRGKGAALATGLQAARTQGYEWALLMDGDGQHAGADIPAFLRAALSNTDVIVGNRMAAPHGMPWLRRQVNRWMSRRLSRRAGQPLPDSQCGFRLLRLAAWAQLELATAHFEVESEMLLALAAARNKITFVPVQVIYKAEQSKIHPLADTWRWFRWWWSGPVQPVQPALKPVPCAPAIPPACPGKATPSAP